MILAMIFHSKFKNSYERMLNLTHAEDIFSFQIIQILIKVIKRLAK